MEWRPIESAPRDGTWLLLWCPAGLPGRTGYETEGFEITVGSWTAGERSVSQWQSIEQRTEYHDYGGMTGVSVWTEALPCAPTHWMPLPEPPAIVKAKIGEVG